MSKSFICVVVCVRISFFLKAEQYSIVCIYYILFTHSFTDGYLGCFHILAIVDTVAMDIMCLFQILFSILLAIYPEVGLLVILFLVFWGATILVFTEAAPFYIPISNHNLSASSPTLIVFCFFKNSCPNDCGL